MSELSIAAEVLHITNPYDRIGSLAAAHQVLTGEPLAAFTPPQDPPGFQKPQKSYLQT